MVCPSNSAVWPLRYLSIHSVLALFVNACHWESEKNPKSFSACSASWRIVWTGFSASIATWMRLFRYEPSALFLIALTMFKPTLPRPNLWSIGTSLFLISSALSTNSGDKVSGVLALVILKPVGPLRLSCSSLAFLLKSPNFLSSIAA